MDFSCSCSVYPRIFCVHMTYILLKRVDLSVKISEIDIACLHACLMLKVECASENDIKVL